MKMSGWFVAPVVLGAALMLGGCCGGKIADCNKIITKINKNGEETKKATDEFTASKKAAADDDKFSKTIDKVGDEVKARYERKGKRNVASFFKKPGGC